MNGCLSPKCGPHRMMVSQSHLLRNLSCLCWCTATPSLNTQSLCLDHSWETMNGLLPQLTLVCMFHHCVIFHSHDKALWPQQDDECSRRVCIVQSRRKRCLLRASVRAGGGLR